ncbi:hypothetical protein C8R44DRAFT_979881 [Mycena epipterygia]|nr:hypothetical protein C8R44DRAFT_979881 [Mycena epipterygia]
MISANFLRSRSPAHEAAHPLQRRIRFLPGVSIYTVYIKRKLNGYTTRRQRRWGVITPRSPRRPPTRLQLNRKLAGARRSASHQYAIRPDVLKTLSTSTPTTQSKRGSTSTSTKSHRTPSPRPAHHTRPAMRRNALKRVSCALIFLQRAVPTLNASPAVPALKPAHKRGFHRAAPAVPPYSTAHEWRRRIRSKLHEFSLNMINQCTNETVLLSSSIASLLIPSSTGMVFFQSNNSWADGEVFVSQCPIAVSTSFLYTFPTIKLGRSSTTAIGILSGAISVTDLLPTGSVFMLPANGVVELSIPGGSAVASPPFHLHGHNFFVIKSAGNDTFNLDNPDAVSTGSDTTFVTDNSGLWILHWYIFPSRPQNPTPAYFVPKPH